MSHVITEGGRELALYADGVRMARAFMEDDCADVLVLLIDRLRAINQERCVPPKSDGDIYQIAYRCVKAAAKSIGGEKSAKASVLSRLERHFDIFEEVWGTHWSGRRLRIDAIITPKDDSEWKTKSPRIGIEFKNFRGFNASFDMKDYTKWWAQCHDYAETNFDDHGYVFVFSYNGFSHYRQRIKNDSAAAFAVRFWGRLGVGEIQPKELLFVMNGSNKIWSERRGVVDGRRISMDRKFGSR